MRILLIAPVFVRVSRDVAGPGGQIALLAEGLHARGHQVTVRTSEPTTLPVAVEQVRLPGNSGKPEIDRLRRLYAVRVLAGADCYDAVHSFAGEDVEHRAVELELPLFSQLSDTSTGVSKAPTVRYVARSWAAAERAVAAHPGLAVAGVVYPALPVDDLPFVADNDGYLVALGPVGPAAGTDLAVAAARKAETPLVLLGPAAPGASEFVERELAHRLDGVLVRMEQPSSAAARRDLIARAAAVVLATRARHSWEPCAAEALAMGTPVITLDRGVARELVTHGETGFVVQDAAGLAAAIDRLDTIDPRACRRRAYHLWDLRQAAATAEALYCSARAIARPNVLVHPEFAAV